MLDQLENDGLADDTIVFYYSDHGRGMPRSKSFLFESSTHVPLLIRFPEKFQALAPAEPGGVVERMAAFVDFAPTVLSLAGIEPPRHFHGRAFLGKYAGEAAQYVFGYRDRMDERYEFIRSVRGRRFKYIRNYFPHLPWFHKQTRLYPSTHPVAASWHRLARAGELTGAARIYMAATKPREQLFDLENDPHELRNLAGDPQYEDKLKELRGAHREWVVAKRDLGFLPESDMWLRFGGAAAAAAAADRQAYPIERILETADWVGGGSEFVGRQQDRLADDDPTVRFWAALGLARRGRPSAARRNGPESASLRRFRGSLHRRGSSALRSRRVRGGSASAARSGEERRRVDSLARRQCNPPAWRQGRAAARGTARHACRRGQARSTGLFSGSAVRPVGSAGAVPRCASELNGAHCHWPGPPGTCGPSCPAPPTSSPSAIKSANSAAISSAPPEVSAKV